MLFKQRAIIFTLVGSQLTKKAHKTFICERCLAFSHSEEKLAEHEKDCRQYEGVKAVMPLRYNMMEFMDFNRSMKAPYVIDAGCESMTKAIQTCAPSDESSYKTKT
jgi:hypothetical protein